MAIFFFFADPKTLYDCQHFITQFQFLICCSGWRTCRRTRRFVSNKWTISYTLLIALILLTGLSYAIYAKFSNPCRITLDKLSFMEGVMFTISFLEILASICSFIVTMTAALWNSQRHMKILESISLMDQCLISDFGANMNYHKLMRKNIMIGVPWLIMYLSSVCLAVDSLSNGDFPVIFLGGMSYALITSGPHFMCYVHINTAELLKIRFRLLQRLLNRDYLLRCFPDETLRESRVHSAVEMVKTLHMLIPEISTVFMLCLLSTLVHDLALATSEMYMIFESSFYSHTSGKMMFFISVCMFAPFYNVFVAPLYCHLAVKEGSKCLALVNQIDVWFPESKLLHELVASTLYWQMSQTFKFYCGVNIVFDKTIMTMVITVMVSYLMILVQFGMIQDLEGELDVQKKAFYEWFELSVFENV